MPSAYALGINSGKIIFISRLERPCLQSVAIKAPVGLLSGRAVCVSRWRGVAPTSSAERSKRFFHERSCDGKMHLISATFLVKMVERNARRRSVLPKSRRIFP